MSLKIVEQVGQDNPTLLSMNLGRTCFKHTTLVIERLRAAGHEAYLISKTGNEGRYVPLDFTPFEITGLDGVTKYTCTGFSHDAIWCDGKQYDTLGSANEHDQPIYRIPNSIDVSFDPASGPQIRATATWNEITRENWRNNNPPFKGHVTQPPTPTPTHVHPDRGEMMRAMEHLHKFYKAAEGLQRAEGLWKNNAPDFEGIGAWVFDVYFDARVHGKNATEAVVAMENAIRESSEWKTKHP